MIPSRIKPYRAGHRNPYIAVGFLSSLRYLVAFGPSSHRAWVVGQGALQCSLGSPGRSLGCLKWYFRGLFGAGLGPLGAWFGPLGGLFWASWGLLGASWGPLGASRGPLRALLGPPGAPGSGNLNFLNFFAPLLAPSGPVLGPSWAVLGASWAVLGPSGAVLEPSWGPLGPSWGRLRVILTRLGAS